MAKKERKKNKENEEGLGSKLISSLFIFLIIVIWIIIIIALIKFDVGGFGSSVLRPALKDVPVINMILPKPSEDELEEEAAEVLEENQIATLSQAKELIEQLQEENEKLVENNKDLKEKNSDYEKQIERLQVFEDNQNEFLSEKENFYNEIIYGENAPDADKYIKWYETIAPANAEAIYKQLIIEESSNTELRELGKTYENMKPAEAAKVLEKMKNDLDTVAEILSVMKADSRAKIMDQMDPAFAANVTKKLMP